MLNVHPTHASKQQGVSDAKSSNDPRGDSNKGFERVETVGVGFIYSLATDLMRTSEYDDYISQFDHATG